MSGASEPDAAMVRLLRKVKAADNKQTRSLLLRQTAELLVEVRQQYTTASGAPDWAGRSWAYRQWVSEMFTRAGFDRPQAETISAGLRYHAGNILRDKLTVTQLHDAGLMAAAPIERAEDARHHRAALLKTVRGDHRQIDPVRATAAALALLNRVTPETLAGLRGKDRTTTAAVVKKLRVRLDELAEQIQQRR